MVGVPVNPATQVHQSGYATVYPDDQFDSTGLGKQRAQRVPAARDVKELEQRRMTVDTPLAAPDRGGARACRFRSVTIGSMTRASSGSRR